MQHDSKNRLEDSKLINSIAAVQMGFSQYDRAFHLLVLSNYLVPDQKKTLLLLAQVLSRLKEFEMVLLVLRQIEGIRKGPFGKHEHQLKSHALAILGRVDEAKMVSSNNFVAQIH